MGFSVDEPHTHPAKEGLDGRVRETGVPKELEDIGLGDELVDHRGLGLNRSDSSDHGKRVGQNSGGGRFSVCTIKTHRSCRVCLGQDTSPGGCFVVRRSCAK